MQRQIRCKSVGRREVFVTLTQDRIGDQAGLLEIAEIMEVRFCYVQSFARPKDPVVECSWNRQVGAAGATEEKFVVAFCRSLSIRLLSRQVQFESRARSPAVRPAASISSKSASA